MKQIPDKERRQKKKIRKRKFKEIKKEFLTSKTQETSIWSSCQSNLSQLKVSCARCKFFIFFFSFASFSSHLSGCCVYRFWRLLPMSFSQYFAVKIQYSLACGFFESTQAWRKSYFFLLMEIKLFSKRQNIIFCYKPRHTDCCCTKNLTWLLKAPFSVVHKREWFLLQQICGRHSTTIIRKSYYLLLKKGSSTVQEGRRRRHKSV